MTRNLFNQDFYSLESFSSEGISCTARFARWNAAQESRVAAAVTTGRSGDEGAPSRLYYTAALLMCRPGNKKPSSAALKVTSGHARAGFIG